MSAPKRQKLTHGDENTAQESNVNALSSSLSSSSSTSFRATSSEEHGEEVSQEKCETQDENSKKQLPLELPHFIQHYRYSNVSVPGFDFPSGSFVGTFSVALDVPHNPSRPRLLQPMENYEHEHFADDPFIQIESSDLPASSPFASLEDLQTTVFMDADDTICVDFTLFKAHSDLRTAVANIEMETSRANFDLMVSSRGGYIDLSAYNEDAPIEKILNISIPRKMKLYCVIANEPLPKGTQLLQWRKPDAISFWALAMGTHARLGAASPSFLKSEGVVREIFSFLKFECDFDALTKRVGTWMALPKFLQTKFVKNELSGKYEKTFDGTFQWRSLTASDLVREYRRFLTLKTREEDWTSTILSPPMEYDPYTNCRILDEVWHLHISSPNYVEDIQLLTNGHQIQHHPVLRESAQPRYVLCRELAETMIADADEPGVLLSETSDWKHRLWPVIPEYDSSDDYGSDGCC